LSNLAFPEIRVKIYDKLVPLLAKALMSKEVSVAHQAVLTCKKVSLTFYV
jgi:hypothetical protein